MLFTTLLMIPLKCNNLNFSAKKFCCAFDHSEVRKYLLIQLYWELQNTKHKRGARHICKMHRESHYCFQILSLASSITTLFPLTTIIPEKENTNINVKIFINTGNLPILFCPPALGNSMASLSTRFMNGSNPQRVPSTWTDSLLRILQNEALKI